MSRAAIDNFYEEVPVPDASADQAALELHIDQELGLPTNEEPKDANEDGETTEDEATTDADGGAEDGQADEAAEADDPEPDDPADQKADQPAVGPSISVTDINGKQYQITKIEDLPEDFTPKNNRQVIEILNDLGKLEAETVRAAADAERQQVEAEAQAQQQAQLKSWDSEIDQLQKAGRIDAPKAAPGSESFMDDPAVKKVDAVFKFMSDTNHARQAAGNPNLIRSFEDALDKYELTESKKAAAAAEKAETATAKKNASLIGGASAAGGESAPVYRAGQARDIWDL